MGTGTPSGGPQQDPSRAGGGSPVGVRVAVPAVCDYCEEPNVAIAGWHVYVESEPGLESSYRVPCAIDPPDDITGGTG